MAGADMAEETGWTASSETGSQRWSLRGAGKRLSDRTPLRTKLITAVLVLVIMALAAISVASVYMLRGYVTTERDATLVADFSNVNLRGLQPGQAGPAVGGSGVIIGVQKPGSQLTLVSPSGFPGFGNSGNNASLPALPTSTDWANSPSPVLLTVPSQSGSDSWRVIAQTVSNYQYLDSNGNRAVAPTATVAIAIDLGNINALTTRLIVFDVIVGGAIVVVLAAVAAAVVRANLRPLNDIELTAGQIAAGHLDHRVPEGDPRTEVGSLGRSLNTMLSQIESAFHAREASEQAAHRSEERMRRFIADASHELRTPLTTIRGFAAHYRQRGGASSMRPEGAVPEGAGVGVAGEEPSPSARTGSAGSAPATHFPGSGLPPDGLSPEDLDHLMGRVEAEATRMGLLVEDLLTLARLDQQRPLTKAPVDLLTLAADAVQDARIVSPGRPIDLTVAPGTAFLVDGDEPRLRQVLGNLVNNAITHTPAGTPVRVKIARGALEARSGNGADGSAGSNGSNGTSEALRQTGRGWGALTGEADRGEARGRAVPAVVLDVEDDGPGMTADQAQRVFERFYRADAARNRASGGTGLGLAIVAGLVAAHGGTVSVDTAPGQGADFQVKLPLSPDALAVDDLDDDPPA
jgi:two-component system OmpR family sensor kinase